MSEAADPIKETNISKKILEILAVLIIPGAIILVGNSYGIESTLGLILSGIVGYTVYILLALYMFKRNDLSLSELGFRTPKSKVKTVFSGIGIFLLIALMYLVIQNIAAVLFASSLPPTDLSRFDPLVGNNTFLIISIIGSWTTIAFGEEIVYRVFLITWFTSMKMSQRLAVVLSAVVFGFAHFGEGPVGILTTMLMGLILGTVYVRSNKNIWITIIAHGLLNTTRFLFIYFAVT